MSFFNNDTIPGIFQNNTIKYGEKACVSFKTGDKYSEFSWNEINLKVRELSNYLLSLGIKKGDRIGLFSQNRYEWFVADMAIESTGAVNVPIYATNSSDEAKFILSNSESILCFVGSEEHLERLLAAKKKLPKLKNIVLFDKSGRKKTAGLLTLDEAYEKGRAFKKKDLLEQRIKSVKTSDVATIMYTSGTTGDPKGVVLTHANFVSNLRTVMLDMDGLITDADIFLSFLPLSHSLERTAGYYLPMYIGAKIAYAEDLTRLMDAFKEVRPTVMISVPRIYEKVHSGILSKVSDAPAIRKKIFAWATGVAKKNLPYVCKDLKRSGIFAIQFAIADKLVFSKLKTALGLDRLKYAISGGGPLSVADAEFFIGMGMKIMEGFGLTETTPVTHFNRPWDIKPGTVGQPLAETVVKISDEGELLIKGPQVMKGYYKNPKATKAVFTKDGFFKTGDMGRIDDNGFLTITGRIKDIIVTAGGKNISPQNIENSIKFSRYIEQIAIIGDRRKFLTALIIPSVDELKKWAKKHHIAYSSIQVLLAKPEVSALIESEIDLHTRQFARVEQIRRFTLLEAEWTQATGELTPTQKVKRRVIEEKYKKIIDEMYKGDVD